MIEPNRTTLLASICTPVLVALIGRLPGRSSRGAGVGMAVVGGFNPLTTPWLATKLVLLLAYIGLGTLALKRGKTPQQRAIAFVLALAALAAIVHVALSKQGWWA